MKYDDKALWFLFHNKLLLLARDTQAVAALPTSDQIQSLIAGEDQSFHYLGTFGSHPCYAVELPSMPAIDRFELAELRSAYDTLGQRLYTLAGKGAELIHWDRHSRFCPACGTPTLRHSATSKLCPACKNEMFPNISVATIVLVQKGDEALLVRGRNNPRKTHGLVAGFLEPGETLEECVAREVLEETGLVIGNVAYFASQPWPYPCGLMAGFTAEYQSGEIVVQEEEIISAAFFSRDNLPALPAKLSIARSLIDWWLEHKKSPIQCSRTGD